MRVRPDRAGVTSGVPSVGGPRTLIGGVGYRWQRDASIGVVAADVLSTLEWPPNVSVADLGYGAIYAAMDLAAFSPPLDRLILIAACDRGRAPGSIHRYTYEGSAPDPEETLARIREAGAGVIDLDHLLVIAQEMRALPPHVIVMEIEPLDREPGVDLSEGGRDLLASVVKMVQDEVGQPA